MSAEPLSLYVVAVSDRLVFSSTPFADVPEEGWEELPLPDPATGDAAPPGPTEWRRYALTAPPCAFEVELDVVVEDPPPRPARKAG